MEAEIIPKIIWNKWMYKFFHFLIDCSILTHKYFFFAKCNTCYHSYILKEYKIRPCKFNTSRLVQLDVTSVNLFRNYSLLLSVFIKNRFIGGDVATWIQGIMKKFKSKYNIDVYSRNQSTWNKLIIMPMTIM